MPPRSTSRPRIGAEKSDLAIIRDGAPVRGLTRIMPAFRDLLTAAEIRSVIDYIHSLCHESGWPFSSYARRVCGWAALCMSRPT